MSGAQEQGGAVQSAEELYRDILGLGLLESVERNSDIRFVRDGLQAIRKRDATIRRGAIEECARATEMSILLSCSCGLMSDHAREHTAERIRALAASGPLSEQGVAGDGEG